MVCNSDGACALSYLKKREIGESTIKKFQIGYVPENANHQLANRIVFPIFSSRSSVVALSSRWISKKNPFLPIYWHEHYNKSFYLYGLYLAKQRIRETGFCVVVEGNLDVLQCHDKGLTNVVGLLGTSLSDVQLALLLR